MSAPKPEKWGEEFGLILRFLVNSCVREGRMAGLTYVVYRETIRVQYRFIEFRNSQITPTSFQQ